MAEQAEQEPVAAQAEGEDTDEEEGTCGYKAPAPKPLNEIVQLDQDDESLRKYKEALLGTVGCGDDPCPDKKGRVIVQKLCLEVEGRDAIEMDLNQEPEDLKKTKVTLKEGVMYRLRIHFVVSGEIVSGLKYYHTVHRKGIKVDKFSCMFGSFPPKKDVQSARTQEDEAPSGMLARGDYKIKSKFTDDDKQNIKQWEWTLCIKKDWE